jgi:Undecaprenyl-phosphate galactose phosphotransferase WbaP
VNYTIPSPHSGAVEPSRFRVGLPAGSHFDRTKPRIEEIVANHSAIQPSRRLCAAYWLQSVVTGVPLLCVDTVVTAGGLIVSSYVVNLSQGHGLSGAIWLQLAALLMLQVLFLSFHQLYPGAGLSPVTELRGIVRSSVLSLLCLSAMNVVLGQLPRIEFLTFVSTALIVSASLPLARWTARHLLARTSWWGTRILLIGQRDDCVATFAQLIRRRGSGFIPAGYTCHAEDAMLYSMTDARLLGENADAAAVARERLAPVAAMVSPDDRRGQTDRLIFQFPSLVWIDFASAARRDFDASNVPDIFTTRMHMPFLRFMPRLAKRSIDLAICIPTLLLFAVPMLLIIWIIKRISPGPAFFAHTRIGQHGATFRAWKFRTMVTNGDELLQAHLNANPEARLEWERDQKLKDDPRVLGTVGRFLRKWSLDELPQLWNVLRGEMSLVGPRPIVYSEIAKYSHGYLAYSHMTPGITGLWQISGRNRTSYATRVSIDEHYARNWSPWLDLWVLIKTPAVVLTRYGAY